MFPITITLNTPAQLNAVMAALALPQDATPTAAPGKRAKPEVASPAPSPRTAEAAVADAPAPSTAQPEPQTSTAPAVAASSAVEAFDYAVLAKAVNAAVPKHGRDTLMAIAVKHGAATFKLLPETTWAAAHADVVALG